MTISDYTQKECDVTTKITSLEKYVERNEVFVHIQPVEPVVHTLPLILTEMPSILVLKS